MTIYDDIQGKSGKRGFDQPRQEIVRLLERTPLKTSQLSSVLTMAGEAIPGSSMTLYLLNREKDILQEIVSHGRTVNVFEQLHFGGGTGLAGWVMRQRRPLFLRGRNPENDGVRETHDTLLFIPLRDGDQPLGLLAASHAEPDGLDQECRAFLRETAEQMAQALMRRVTRTESPAATGNRSSDEYGDRIPADRNALDTAGKLARETVAEIDHAVSVIIGSVRMVELEADNLPPAVAGHLRAIIGEARQISLSSHKLSHIDRLLAGGDRVNESHSNENVPRSVGDMSC